MTTQAPQEDSTIEDEPSLAERVAQIAQMVSGIDAIGHATRLLNLAGFEATIAANRITVNHEIEAKLTNSNGASWWDVYSIDGKPPLFVVGAHVETDITSWMAAD